MATSGFRIYWRTEHGSVISQKKTNLRTSIDRRAILFGRRTMSTRTRTFGFGLRAFKKFPELIPLAVIITGTATMATAFIGFSLRTKPDVRLVGRNIEMPYDMVKPTECRKLVTINQKYEPIPELEALRKEIGSFKN